MVLAGGLLVSSVAHAASAPVLGADGMIVEDRAERLQVQAQDTFDSGNYVQAGLEWVSILGVLHENEVNRAERDNALQLGLESLRQAYLPHLTDEPDDVPADIVEGLRAGAEAYRLYLAQFADNYGGDVAVTPSLRDKGETILQYAARFEVDTGETGGPTLGDPPPPCLEGYGFDCPGPDHQNSGLRLIGAGAGLMVAGLGTSSMIIVGAMRAKAARRDEPPRTDRQARGLIIGGAVATGVLVAAGSTLLGIGISRRLRYIAVAPVVGGRMTGVRVRGRF